MQTEIEAKILSVDHDEIRNKLKEIGGILELPMRLMRRVTFNNAGMLSRNGWLRVRDEGGRVTFTYKQSDSHDIHGTKEIETTVGDFDLAISILRQIGMEHDSYQESKREIWRVGEVEVMLDEWPWIDTFIEIEGPTAESVEMLAVRLGFDPKDAVYGGVMSAYRKQYPWLDRSFTIGDLPTTRFSDPVPKELVRS